MTSDNGHSPTSDPSLLHLPAAPGRWLEFYRRHLLEFVMPFWLRHAVDDKHGGLFTCLTDEGELNSTDKYIWSQARALWTFSALYQRIEKREQWLNLAHSLFDFCRRHGFDEHYCWRFRTSRNGELIDGPLSIVTDLFGIYGMTEYARITGNKEAIDIAVRTARSVQARLTGGGPFGTAPYPLPEGMKAHRYSMQCSLALHELGMFLKDEGTMQTAWGHTRDIMDHFVRPEHKALVEYVNLDGSFSDTPPGRTMVPGHGIESMWFQLQIFGDRGLRDEVPLALQVMEWCLEKGWDSEHGGLFLGLDIHGKTPVFWKHATAKIWWVAAETLGATLMAYEAEPHPRWLEYHRRVAEWALAKFPVPACGDWRQRLDRTGGTMREIVALPVKDPFHLPRGLIVAVESLQRLREERKLDANTLSTKE